MTVETPLQLRWQRAQQIDPAGIEELGLGWYVVPSSRDPTGDAVRLECDAHASSQPRAVPAGTSSSTQKGRAHRNLHGVRVCSHTTTASKKAMDVCYASSDTVPAIRSQRVPARRVLSLQRSHIYDAVIWS